jgi:hypothetical protein
MSLRLLSERTYPEMTKKMATAKWPPEKKSRTKGKAAE